MDGGESIFTTTDFVLSVCMSDLKIEGFSLDTDRDLFSDQPL